MDSTLRSLVASLLSDVESQKVAVDVVYQQGLTLLATVLVMISCHVASRQPKMAATITHFFVRHVNPVRRVIFEDCLGGPRPLQSRHVINLCKAGTIFVMGMLLVWTGSTNELGPCVYTALHGSYGILWILKDIVMPDATWNKPITIPSSIILFCGLVGYWSPGYFLMLQTPSPTTSLLRAMVAIFLHTIGSAVMMCTDAQKYFILKSNSLPKGTLITDGWTARSRNLNYLGEIMLYSSYAIMAQHWFPWIYYGLCWPLIFGSNMCVKEVSLAQKPHAHAYFQQSGFLFPKLFLARTMTGKEDEDVDASLLYIQELAKIELSRKKRA